MLGWGYYWAINRSYDITYRQQYFTERGFAHHIDFRGKPREGTDFDATFYGVNDKGIQVGDTIQKQGGYLVTVDGRSILGKGWEARGQINYLSSYLFRQNFTESFHEAVMSESHSTGFLDKHWSSFGFYGVFDYDLLFLSTNEDDKIGIRKAPEALFTVRERPLFEKVLPVYFSLESSGGLLGRREPGFQTKPFVERADLEPHVSTAFSFKGFHIAPSFGIRETTWGASVTQEGTLNGPSVFRNARDVSVDIVLPSLSRIFNAPKWTGAEKIKHVFETRATYRYATGIEDFNEVVRFDSTELMSNTNQIEFSITNRFYTKNKNGVVNELVSWQVLQQRYFDPTFGGAIVPGQRNVVLSSAEVTAYSFLDQPRNYSPVVSVVRLNSRVGMEWRSDYDPLRGHVVNSSLSADWRKEKYFVSLGHNQVRNDPVLSPSSNQFRGMVGLGNENRRGWNAGFSAYYDYRIQVLQYALTQVTYNTDCCGFSVQYRRFNFGTRNENQFRIAFVVANIGAVGTLKRQERMF